MIKTFVVNLEKSVNRREYMQNLLSPFDFLDVEFVGAIDGRRMSASELNSKFDKRRSFRRYGRELVPGEIGCTLSHRKCYQALLDSSADYALILEDDISIVRDICFLEGMDLSSILFVDKPTVLFLSGDYWRLGSGDVVSVYDANGAYAYLINREAARVILSLFPSNVADDWRVYKRRGVKYLALNPYCIDANVDMDRLPSDVAQVQWGGKKKNMGLADIMVSIYYGIIERLLKRLGLFVPKIRIIDNKIVE